MAYLVVLFPVVGVLLAIAGWKYQCHLKAKVRACLRATGIVVGSSKGLSGGFDTTPVFHPIVEYSLGDSRFSVTGEVGHGRPKKEGTKLTIMYDPENPSVAFILEDYYFAANGILALGVTFVVMGSWFTYLVFSTGH